jgi:hypothetical protein
LSAGFTLINFLCTEQATHRGYGTDAACGLDAIDASNALGFGQGLGKAGCTDATCAFYRAGATNGARISNFIDHAASIE